MCTCLTCLTYNGQSTLTQHPCPIFFSLSKCFSHSWSERIWLILQLWCLMYTCHTTLLSHFFIFLIYYVVFSFCFRCWVVVGKQLFGAFAPLSGLECGSERLYARPLTNASIGVYFLFCVHQTLTYHHIPNRHSSFLWQKQTRSDASSQNSGN